MRRPRRRRDRRFPGVQLHSPEQTTRNWSANPAGGARPAPTATARSVPSSCVSILTATRRPSAHRDGRTGLLPRDVVVVDRVGLDLADLTPRRSRRRRASTWRAGATPTPCRVPSPSSPQRHAHAGASSRPCRATKRTARRRCTSADLVQPNLRKCSETRKRTLL